MSSHMAAYIDDISPGVASSVSESIVTGNTTLSSPRVGETRRDPCPVSDRLRCRTPAPSWWGGRPPSGPAQPAPNL